MATRKYILGKLNIYHHAYAAQLDDDTLVFRLPERIPFEDREDNITHIVRDNEFLWDIANEYYYMIQNIRSADLWEFIANFQPSPIVDPTVPLRTGRILYVPAPQYVLDVLQGPSLTETPAI